MSEAFKNQISQQGLQNKRADIAPIIPRTPGMSRRKFLILSSILAAVALNAACGGDSGTAATSHAPDNPYQEPRPISLSERSPDEVLQLLNETPFLEAGYIEETIDASAIQQFIQITSPISSESSEERNKHYYAQSLTTPDGNSTTIQVFLPQYSQGGKYSLNEGFQRNGRQIHGAGAVPVPYPTRLNWGALDSFFTTFPSALQEYNTQKPESAGIVHSRGITYLALLPFGTPKFAVPARAIFEFGPIGSESIIVNTAAPISIPLENGEVLSQATHFNTQFNRSSRDHVAFDWLEAGTWTELAQQLTTTYDQPSEDRNNSIGLLYQSRSRNYPFERYQRIIQQANISGKAAWINNVHLFSETFYNSIELTGSMVLNDQ
ncbi:hypothetical protein COY16_05695 [Candidatus Roizmanbacteria bacterium CG_4_10_14_0_2_um_filter_39_13]|uniref:Uncharacterized protein n=1 Tax=Candidatus Roizmanbacteria bacterium CG_4_10_14_0_2_um_filter_39_13 TaxID=1974825 RepID=A0A2M7TVR7_9BACT|nr:MAG: hypothetical protein COY16_05695 [Candidatus Roizmanbacteria bacterium CG_4_10_14_0_2_um_filter_39_13]